MLPVFLNVPLCSILPVMTAVEPLPPDTAKPPEHVVNPVTLRLPCTVFCGQVMWVLPLAVTLAVALPLVLAWSFCLACCALYYRY